MDIATRGTYSVRALLRLEMPIHSSTAARWTLPRIGYRPVAGCCHTVQGARTARLEMPINSSTAARWILPRVGYCHQLIAPRPRVCAGWPDEVKSVRACVELTLQVYNSKLALPNTADTV